MIFTWIRRRGVADIVHSFEACRLSCDWISPLIGYGYVETSAHSSEEASRVTCSPEAKDAVKK